jgi:hypothetical protein
MGSLAVAAKLCMQIKATNEATTIILIVLMFFLLFGRETALPKIHPYECIRQDVPISPDKSSG